MAVPRPVALEETGRVQMPGLEEVWSYAGFEARKQTGPDAGVGEEVWSGAGFEVRKQAGPEAGAGKEVWCWVEETGRT